MLLRRPHFISLPSSDDDEDDDDEDELSLLLLRPHPLLSSSEEDDDDDDEDEESHFLSLSSSEDDDDDDDDDDEELSQPDFSSLSRVHFVLPHRTLFLEQGFDSISAIKAIPIKNINRVLFIFDVDPNLLEFVMKSVKYFVFVFYYNY